MEMKYTGNAVPSSHTHHEIVTYYTQQRAGAQVQYIKFFLLDTLAGLRHQSKIIGRTLIQTYKRIQSIVDIDGTVIRKDLHIHVRCGTIIVIHNVLCPHCNSTGIFLNNRLIR